MDSPSDITAVPTVTSGTYTAASAAATTATRPPHSWAASSPIIPTVSAPITAPRSWPTWNRRSTAASRTSVSRYTAPSR